MSRRIIKVTEVRTYVYEPDLNDDVYKENEISDVIQALSFDRDDYLGGNFELSEVDDKPVVNSEWEIVEIEDEEDVQNATEPD